MHLCSLHFIAQHCKELHLTKRNEIHLSKFIKSFTSFIYNYGEVLFTHRLQILLVGNIYLIDHFVIPALMLAKVYVSKL